MFQFVRAIGGRLATPSARGQSLVDILKYSWPAWRAAGTLYRRTLGRRPRVVAVVGSLGKTTATRTIAAALGIGSERVSTRNEYAFVALSLFQAYPWTRRAVIEVGIGARGQMIQYARMLRPDITVVTSIASDHHRALGSLEVTRAEKCRMVSALSPAGLAVLNGDDPHVVWMREKTQARVVTFGFDTANDVRASDFQLDWPHGSRFKIHIGDTVRDVQIRLFGRAFVYPALAAVAVGLAEGLPLDTILARFGDVGPSPERLEVVRLPSGAYLVRDEFKSSLESIDEALDLLSHVPARRKVVVLGSITDPPSSSNPIYRRIGARVSDLADYAVFVGQNAAAYATGAARTRAAGGRIVKVRNSPRAILDSLPPDLGEGDVILIKGRGSERLARVSLALLGSNVLCVTPVCPFHESLRCPKCDRLSAPASEFNDVAGRAADPVRLMSESAGHG